ncbi:MAG: PAS domain-containing protein [Deinococcota bacterium]
MPRQHMPTFLQELWSTSLAMCILDNQAYIHDVNLAFSASLGCSSRELIGRDMAVLLAEGSGAQAVNVRKQLAAKRCASTQAVWRLPTGDGAVTRLCVLGSWITKHQGELYKLVVTINPACYEEGQALLETRIFNTDTSLSSSKDLTTTTPAPAQDEAQQTISTLRKRIDELEGKVAAYRAILERYKAPGDITTSASSWYAKLGKD